MKTVRHGGIIEKPDLWAKYRKPNGEFKLWLHTWFNTTTDDGWAFFGKEAAIAQYTAPLPWVWDASPQGDIIHAMKIIGILKHCPMHWPNFELRADVQGIVLPNHSTAAFTAWIKNHLNEDYLLFC